MRRNRRLPCSKFRATRWPPSTNLRCFQRAFLLLGAGEGRSEGWCGQKVRGSRLVVAFKVVASRGETTGEDGAILFFTVLVWWEAKILTSEGSSTPRSLRSVFSAFIS